MNQRYTYITILITLWFHVLLINTVHAQKEAGIWYFGDHAGINFNTNPPQIDTLGQISTIEGMSTICDKNTGNLLFYTDGITVWNKNHVAMPNGTGLAGHSSSTQSAVIIPQPGKDSIYYIFTTPQLAQSPGACYSVVDLHLDNGLGDITIKNEVLHPSSCEKVTAAMHCNGKDYWIVFHAWMSDMFYSFSLTSSGVGSMVQSGVGITVTGSVSKTRGEIKLSPDCKKIAIANDNLDAQLLDFDNSTGIISNPVSLNVSPRTYGVCFSPDNSKLYITTGWTERDIYQFDLNASNIPASKTLVATTLASYIGSLQNAPDGKIYAATYGAKSLGVINNPNALGMACNYSDSVISLNGRECKWGLPNFSQNFFNANNNKLVLSYQLDSCSTNGVQVSFAANLVTPDSLVIDYGDGTFSNDLNIPHVYSGNGTYIASLVVYSECKVESDTTSVSINFPSQLNIGNDTMICSGASLNLDASFANASYVWSNGATTSGISVSAENTYWVKVNIDNCSISDTIAVKLNKLNAGFTYEMSCKNDSVYFTDTTSADIKSWFWSFGDGATDSVSNPVHAYATKGNYLLSLTVTSIEGCSEEFVQNINTNIYSHAGFIANDACLGDTTFFVDSSMVNVGTINNWSWKFGDGIFSADQNPTHVYSEAGSYNVILFLSTDAGCSATSIQQVTVHEKPMAHFNLSSEQYCAKTSLTLINSSKIPNGSNIKDYAWDFGDGITSRSKTPIHSYSDDGFYNISLEVTSDMGCRDHSANPVVINSLPLAAFTYDDTYECTSQSVEFIDESSVNGSNIVSRNWEFSDGTISNEINPSHVFYTEGSNTISLTVTSSKGCMATIESTIETDFQEVKADFEVSQTEADLLEANIGFTDNSNGAQTLSWYLGDGTVINDEVNFSHVFGDTGTYTVMLVASSESGCVDSSMKMVTINEDKSLYVPTAFTPNGDGKNDVFTAYGVGVDQFIMRVFDRWGNEIFATDNIESGWNGTINSEKAIAGMYVYEMSVTDISGKIKNLKGGVHLIR